AHGSAPAADTPGNPAAPTCPTSTREHPTQGSATLRGDSVSTAPASPPHLVDGAQPLVRPTHVSASTRRTTLLISLISLGELDTQPGTILRRRPELRCTNPQLTRRVTLPRPMPVMDARGPTKLSPV